MPIKWALSGVSSRILYLTFFFFFLSTFPTDWKIFICKIVSQWENAPREILSIFTLTHVILFKINAFNLEIHERYLAIEKTEKLLSSPRNKKVIPEALLTSIRKTSDNVRLIGTFPLHQSPAVRYTVVQIYHVIRRGFPENPARNSVYSKKVGQPLDDLRLIWRWWNRFLIFLFFAGYGYTSAQNQKPTHKYHTLSNGRGLKESIHS